VKAPVVDAPKQDDSGKIKIAFNGFVATQIAIDSNDAVGQNHLVSVANNGDGARLGFVFDASRLNLVAAASVDGVDFKGRVEADMQSAIFFRIRHVYGTASKNGLSLLLGQTDTLVGNMVGPNLFNNDWFFAQGNAYDRTQQLRVSYDTGKVMVAAAAVPNLYGAVSPAPHFQARIQAKLGKASVGAGAHFGTTNNVTNPADATQTVDGVTSYLVAVDAWIPAGPLFLSAQGWIGSGGAHGTGGHAIGNPLFVVDANGAPFSVPSVGGFFDVLFAVNKKVSAGVAGGASVVTDPSPGGVDVPLATNLTAGAYSSLSISKNWNLAFEVQAAQTNASTDPAAPGTRQALDDIRVLFGQKLSF
jgi:hypothetical protein